MSWLSRTSWRRAAVAGAGTVLATFLASPAAGAAPAPVSNLQIAARDGYLAVTWTASPDTTSSVVCYEPGSAAATSPTDPAAVCTTEATATSAQLFTTADRTYTVTVFSRDASTSEVGAPVSASAVAVDSSPQAPGVSTYGASTTQLRVSVEMGIGWPNDWTDAWDVLLSWAPGLAVPAPPPTEAGHVAFVADHPHGTGRYANFDVRGLTPGVVYTFAARVRDRGGNVGPPGSIHATTRVPGVSVATSATTQRLITTIFGNASAAMPSPGTVEVAFTRRDSRGVYEARLSRAGHWWTHRVASGSVSSGPLLATGPRGLVVVAWARLDGAYYAYRAAGRWSVPTRVPWSSIWDTVSGLAVDRLGRIHVLINGTAYGSVGMSYITNGSGTWTRYHMPWFDSGLLAEDPVTGRIVMVIGDRVLATRVIRHLVTVLSPRATRAHGFAEWWSAMDPAVDTTGGYRTATTVASHDGTITIGVERTNPSPWYRPEDGLYVIAGSATRHGQLTRVPHTTRRDTHLVITAPSAGRQVLTWQRPCPGWDLTACGVRTSQRVYRPTTGTTTYTWPNHWTASPYDSSVAAFRDSRGVMRVVVATHEYDP